MAATPLFTPTPLDKQTFVVVDLETTGGSATYDRVIEVAAVRIQGGVVQERFETLINPCTALPPFITRLTGITPLMLRGQPIMEEVVDRLGSLTSGAILVAHNASFDHGFLAQAFRRAERAWSVDSLCTLRLARRLLPGLHSYKLDSLCAHLDLAYVQRHRAGPDADVTVSLLEHLISTAREHGIEHVGRLLALQKQPVSGKKRKGQVDEAQVASLTTGPGVYLLKDNKGHVVYIGKSVNVRQRVRTHLRPSGTAGGVGQPRLRKRLPYIADVEAIETGSELEALMLESKLVKRYLPDANRKLRDYRDYPFIKLDTADPHPRLVATRERPGPDGVYFGPFRKASTVASASLFISEQLGLRQCRGPLRAGMSACPLLEMRKCLGPCVGAVSNEEYDAAVMQAERLLRGEEQGLIDAWAATRDELGEALRFEEAAELRDRIRDVEHLVGAHQRLQAVAERNLVIVAPDPSARQVRLFLVRAGRLAAEVPLALPARTQTLRMLLRTSYATPGVNAINRDEVDDMLILDAWLRARRTTTVEVPVAPSDLETTLVDLRRALTDLSTTAVTKVANGVTRSIARRRVAGAKALPAGAEAADSRPLASV